VPASIFFLRIENVFDAEARGGLAGRSCIRPRAFFEKLLWIEFRSAVNDADDEVGIHVVVVRGGLDEVCRREYRRARAGPERGTEKFLRARWRQLRWQEVSAEPLENWKFCRCRRRSW